MFQTPFADDEQVKTSLHPLIDCHRDIDEKGMLIDRRSRKVNENDE